MYDFCAETLKAPKWHQRKAGVSYGFGGKLVAFHTTGPSSRTSEVIHVDSAFYVSSIIHIVSQPPSIIFQVDVHDLVTEHSIGSSSSEFEAAMRSRDRSLLRVLCDQKSKESE